MLKILLAVGPLACVLSLTSLGRAQALPTALAKGNLQVGGGLGYAFPDYGQKNIKGISAFVDLDLFMHFGVEGDIHYIALVTPTDLAENTFEIGPRYVYRKGRFAPYAKFLIGRGDLVIQETQDNPGKYSGNYFMGSIGGGLDIQATRHIVIRAIDLEYQRWPNLGNGLSPTVITIGAAYRFR
jgi:Outer membrane protein beta-barrel domain